MKKTALLIIDVQRALCAGEWAAFEIDKVIPRIDAVAAQARAAGAPVILIQHEEEHEQMRYGADGWQLADGLEAQPSDIRMRMQSFGPRIEAVPAAQVRFGA